MSGLLYSLCGFSGFGIVLNLVVLTWQCLYMRVERGYQFLKLGFLMTYISQCLLGLAVVCIILYRDIGGPRLCSAAGFLVLFGGQEALWSMCITTASLHLWTKRKVSRELRHRNVPIFLLVTGTCTVVIIIMSVLPVTSVPYFGSNKEFAFTCTPLRLPGEEGWALSTLTIILCWLALVLTLIPLLLQLSRHSHCWRGGSHSSDAHKDAVAKLNFIKPCVLCQLYVSLSIMTAGWILILIILSSGYFSSGADHDQLQWVLGFCVACTLVAPPGVQLLGRLLRHLCYQEDQKGATLRDLVKNTPDKLDAIHKLVPQRDDDKKSGISRYEVHWQSPGRSRKRGLCGVMKVYPPAARLKWAAELNTLAELGLKNHSNVAEYMWISMDNNYSSLASDVISSEASLVCMSHYRHGSLHTYIDERSNLLTDVTINNITTDIANGLEFIHQHNVLHNNLTAHSIYVADAYKATGFHVVIGDFDHSTVVSPLSKREEANSAASSWKPNPNKTDLYTITQELQVHATNTANVFSSDVRAYGAVLYDMYVAINQNRHYNQLPHHHHHHHHHYSQYQSHRALRMLETPSSLATCTDSQVDMMSLSGKMSQCSCASRVTDLRAHKELEKMAGKFSFSGRDHSFRDSHRSTGSAFHYPQGSRRSRSASQSAIDGMAHNTNDSNNNKFVETRGAGNDTPLRAGDRPLLVLQVPDSSESESDSNVEARARLGKRYASANQILTNGSFVSNKSSQAIQTIMPKPSRGTGAGGGGGGGGEPVGGGAGGAGSKSDVGTSTDDLNPAPYVNSTSANSLPSMFHTIYEDEEVDKDSGLASTRKTTPGGTRLHSSARAKLTGGGRRRGVPPLPPRDVIGARSSKRNSVASVDGSMISSGDSGVGSSHYETTSISDQSSLFTGGYSDRESVYGRNNHRDIDQISLSQLYNMKNHRHSSGSKSREKTPRVHTSHGSKDDAESREQTADNQNENIYERLPDFVGGSPRKRKQPCVGQHKHIHGATCDHSSTDDPPTDTSGKTTRKDNHISKYEQSLFPICTSISTGDSTNDLDDVTVTLSDHHDNGRASASCQRHGSGCTECSIERLYKKHVLAYVDDDVTTSHLPDAGGEVRQAARASTLGKSKKQTISGHHHHTGSLRTKTREKTYSYGEQEQPQFLTLSADSWNDEQQPNVEHIVSRLSELLPSAAV